MLVARQSDMAIGHKWATFCPLMFVFFKQKTAYEMRISDWSPDVCSSDLATPARSPPAPDRRRTTLRKSWRWAAAGARRRRAQLTAQIDPLSGWGRQTDRKSVV